MLLAELEVFQSRPIAPTRRLALGIAVLPTDPTPGFGGLLLAGVVATFAPALDKDMLPDLKHLTHELEAGKRIPQPRLRHRLQDDRVGLNQATHRLMGNGDSLDFQIDSAGNPEPHVLAAVYAAGRLATGVKEPVFATIRRAMAWDGPLGADFVAHLSESKSTVGWATLGGRDPVIWALGILGLEAQAAQRAEVQGRFRELLRDAHPDHGAAADTAASRISDLTEARRILLSK